MLISFRFGSKRCFCCAKTINVLTRWRVSAPELVQEEGRGEGFLQLPLRSCELRDFITALYRNHGRFASDDAAAASQKCIHDGGWLAVERALNIVWDTRSHRVSVKKFCLKRPPTQQSWQIVVVFFSFISGWCHVLEIIKLIETVCHSWGWHDEDDVVHPFYSSPVNVQTRTPHSRGIVGQRRPFESKIH